MHCLQLMRKNPEKRLGSGANDSDEVMRQGFFRVRLLFFLSFFPYGAGSRSCLVLRPRNKPAQGTSPGYTLPKGNSKDSLEINAN